MHLSGLINATLQTPRELLGHWTTEITHYNDHPIPISSRARVHASETRATTAAAPAACPHARTTFTAHLLIICSTGKLPNLFATPEPSVVAREHVADVDGKVAHLGRGAAAKACVVAGKHVANTDGDVANFGVSRGREIERGHCIRRVCEWFKRIVIRAHQAGTFKLCCCCCCCCCCCLHTSCSAPECGPTSTKNNSTEGSVQ